MKNYARAAVNWILLLSIPIWGGVALVIAIFQNAGSDPDTKAVLRGQRWIWG
jgi:hypothetical protein